MGAFARAKKFSAHSPERGNPAFANPRTLLEAKASRPLARRVASRSDAGLGDYACSEAHGLAPCVPHIRPMLAPQHQCVCSPATPQPRFREVSTFPATRSRVYPTSSSQSDLSRIDPTSMGGRVRTLHLVADDDGGGNDDHQGTDPPESLQNLAMRSKTTSPRCALTADCSSH